MLKTLMEKASSKYPFGADDFFQQVIGSAILTTPFLFTEEAWTIAGNTSPLQSTILVALALGIGHGILYVAHSDRDWEVERKFFGVTLRYLSLMAVSFGTVIAILLLTGTIETFNAGLQQTTKMISMVAVFAVIGAATADNLV